MKNVGLLIVQQENIERQMTCSVLENDFSIFVSESFDDAYDCIEKNRIDVAILDVSNNEDTVGEFIFKLKNESEYKNIILIAMLGAHGKEVTYELVKSGINYIFVKPIDPTMLKLTLSSIQKTFLDERSLLKARIKSGDDRFRGVLEAIPGGVIAVTKSDKYYIDYVSERAEKLLKYGEFEKYNIEHDLFYYVEKEDIPDLRIVLEEKALLGTPVKTRVRIRRGDNTYRYYDANIKCIMIGNGDRHYDIIINPAPEKVEKEEILKREISKLQKRSMLDPLTRVLSKESFYKETKRLLDNNKGTDFVVGVLNLDRFKAVNELFGSKTGDKIICEFADFIMNRVKDVPSTVGRLESDHFVVCLPRYFYDEKESELDGILNGSVRWNSLNYTIYLHLGLYCVSPDDVDIAIVCDRAHMALAQIKDSFVTRRKFFTSSLRDALVTEQNIMKDARKAIDNEEFFVMFQPIVDVQTREIAAAEALVRWKKPDGSYVSPGEFIPTFERNGFVSEIDKYVWEKVCRFQSERKKAGKRIVPVSVNLSRMDFYNPHLYEDLIDITHKYELDSDCLKVEITESAYMDQPKELMSIIQKFQDDGYKVLMDDFGSGYSSLNMLKDVSVDVLKIDMRFMDNLDTSDKAGNILFSIIQMAKAIHMEVVAEGVETVNQYEMLLSMDCDHIQGYYFYRPMPADEFGKQLDANKREMSVSGIAGYRKIIFLGKNSEVVAELADALDNNCEIISIDKVNDIIEFLRYQFSNVSMIIADFTTSREESLCLIDRLSDKSFYSDVPVVGLVTGEMEEEIAQFFGNGLRDVLRIPYTKQLLRKRIDTIIELAEIETEKRAVQVLRKNMLMRQQIASFFEDSCAGILRLKLLRDAYLETMDVAYVNDSFLKIFQITLDEINTNAVSMMGKNLRNASRIKFRNNFVKSISEEKSYFQQQVEIERGDGAISNVLICCSVKYHTEEFILDVVAVDSDVRVADSMQQTVYEALFNTMGQERVYIWRYSVYEDTNDFFRINSQGVYERGCERCGFENVIRKLRINDTDAKRMRELKKRLEEGSEKETILVEGLRPEEDGTKIIPVILTFTRSDIEDDLGKVYTVIFKDAGVKKEIALNKWRAEQYSRIFASDGRYRLEIDLTSNKAVDPDEFLSVQRDTVGIHDSYDVMLERFLSSLEIDEAINVRKKISREALLNSYERGNNIVNFSFMYMTKNETKYLWYEGEAVMGVNSTDSHVLCTIILRNLETDGVKKYSEPVYKITEKDSLTGLSNRVMLQKSMDMFMKKHLDDEITSCLVVIDVDNFQKVNDVFGHDVGDSVLRTLSKTLSDDFNNGEVISRLGGDEFGIFVPDVSDEEQIRKKLDSICKEAVLTLNNYGDKIVVSCSIGCVFVNDMEDNFKHVYSLAARALVTAKKKGKKCYAVYDE